MHCAMLVFLHLSRLEKRQRNLTDSKRTKNTHLHIDEFMLVEFITISKTFSNNFQLITNSKNVLLVHEIVEKHHAASRKCKTQFGRKINWFVVVDKRHAHPGKINSHQNVQIHLQMRSMQQVYFVNNHWSSCPGTLAPKTFAPSCKVQKTSKNISIPDVIPPFCSKSRAVCKEDIVVTKFQLPYQVMQKRSTCSPYQREFILP